MSVDITPPASAIFPDPLPEAEPIGALIDHACWWLRTAPEASEFNGHGREARYLIAQLALRAVADAERAGDARELRAALLRASADRFRHSYERSHDRTP
jgi:hypothetical protein